MAFVISLIGFTMVIILLMKFKTKVQTVALTVAVDKAQISKALPVENISTTISVNENVAYGLYSPKTDAT